MSLVSARGLPDAVEFSIDLKITPADGRFNGNEWEEAGASEVQQSNTYKWKQNELKIMWEDFSFTGCTV